MNRIIKRIWASLLVLPVVASAQLITTNTFITQLRGIVNQLIYLVSGIALLVFLWGLVKFIFKVGGSETAVAEGRKLMGWGLVALFVMISVWGIIRLLQDEFLPGSDFGPPPAPTI